MILFLKALLDLPSTPCSILQLWTLGSLPFIIPLGPPLFAVFSHTRFCLVPISAVTIFTWLPLDYLFEMNPFPSLHTATFSWSLNLNIILFTYQVLYINFSKEWADNSIQNMCHSGASNLMEGTELKKKYSQIDIKFQTARSGLKER